MTEMHEFILNPKIAKRASLLFGAISALDMAGGMLLPSAPLLVPLAVALSWTSGAIYMYLARGFKAHTTFGLTKRKECFVTDSPSWLITPQLSSRSHTARLFARC